MGKKRKEFLRTTSRTNVVFTLRGFFFLIFLAYLLLGPVRKESDVVASVFGYSLLGLICLCAIISQLQGRAFRNYLRFQIASESGPAVQRPKGAETGETFSGRKTRMVVKLNPVKILPLFVLRVELEFRDEDILLAVHQVTGRSEGNRYLIDELIFPHRGEWHLKTMHFRFGDQLGFCSYYWRSGPHESMHCVRVRPPPREGATLPIVSSSARSGDTVLDITQRQGDPFDLKPYHPSDGMHRILWKVYAKSRELISRHPERSMTPEGQVIIFGAFTKHDDESCAVLLSYLRQLEDLDLQIFFGCEGMERHQICHDSQGAEELLIDSVWMTERSSSESLRDDLNYLVSEVHKTLQNMVIQNVLVFFGPARLTDEANYQLLDALGSALEAQGITPVFCATEGPHSSTFRRTPARLERENEASERATKLLKKLLLDSRAEAQRPDPIYYPKFLSRCSERSWQVMV